MSWQVAGGGAARKVQYGMQKNAAETCTGSAPTSSEDYAQRYGHDVPGCLGSGIWSS